MIAWKIKRLFHRSKAQASKGRLEYSSCGRVWLTVHSPDIRLDGGGVLRDAVELNWDFNGCSSVPAQIGLFNSRPTSWNSALARFDITSREGHVITPVPLGSPILPGGWENGGGIRGPHCLWPWVGAGNNQIEAFNCLKIQPTWMEDNA
ncbi:hypothetical protein EVAR_56852_1, partial [Eumeta japonica]